MFRLFVHVFIVWGVCRVLERLGKVQHDPSDPILNYEFWGSARMNKNVVVWGVARLSHRLSFKGGFVQGVLVWGLFLLNKTKNICLKWARAQAHSSDPISPSIYNNHLKRVPTQTCPAHNHLLTIADPREQVLNLVKKTTCRKNKKSPNGKFPNNQMYYVIIRWCIGQSCHPQNCVDGGLPNSMHHLMAKG